MPSWSIATSVPRSESTAAQKRQKHRKDLKRMTTYLKKRTLYPKLIQEPPADTLNIVIVIPARDEPALIDTLQCLAQCRLMQRSTEVIVVINGSEADETTVKERNRRSYEALKAWIAKTEVERVRFFGLYFPELKKKHAGVGLARKIGMDEACRRLEAVENPDGIIVGFDADSRCDLNYLREIERHFQDNPYTNACSIYFEHPLEGSEYASEIYRAITLYELHLRYYVNAQRYAGFPYAFQTIGSSMAVRCRAYQEQGGMNRRKAGEDFYFLHKFTALGHFSELNTTCVVPSPRISHRVPFGTGKAVGTMMKKEHIHYDTYAPESFETIRPFFSSVPTLFGNSSAENGEMLKTQANNVQAFLEHVNFRQHYAEIRANTTSVPTFTKRFFQWFNAFMVMKYLHFSRDHYFPNQPVERAAGWLLEKHNRSGNTINSAKELLWVFRRLSRS